MSAKIYVASALWMSVMLGSCKADVPSGNPDGGLVSNTSRTTGFYYLTESQIAELSARSEKFNDKVAADKLVDHYMYGDPDRVKAEKWLAIASKNGSYWATMVLFSTMRFKDLESCTRGRAMLDNIKGDLSASQQEDVDLSRAELEQSCRAVKAR